MTYRFVSAPADLDSALKGLGSALAKDPRLAVDTEFVREKSYTPWLELVQLATSDGQIVLIDTRTLDGKLAPLGALLGDPGILKIAHAIGQDAEILHVHLGVALEPVFDTQVASSFAGQALQVGYGKLVQSTLGVALSKGDTMSDWSKRPIAPSLQDYAAADVEHLHALHDRLSAELKRRGREAWAHDFTAQIVRSMTATVEPDAMWRKVGGRQSLNRRELSVLRELSIWRDDAARERDKPLRSIVKDEVLVELARRSPVTTRAVLDLRSVPQGLGERRAQEIVDCVKAGRAVPPDQQPVPEQGVMLDDQGGALYELLSAVVRVRAIEADLPPSLLASADALRYVAATRDPEIDSPLFQGWRNELVGDVLRDALAGRISVGWDTGANQLTLRRV